MSIISAQVPTSEIKKQLFYPKPAGKDGLILQIYHKIKHGCHTKFIRFIYSKFDKTGLIIANADIEGNIYIIDLSNNKYWSIAKLHPCTCLAFSSINNDDLIIACNDGNLYIINIHIGNISGILEGHSLPVKHISFAREQCLTASANQAIIFNLFTFNKIHELSIDSATNIKQMFFMPVTNNIFACFSDDYIHVWKHETFDSFKKLLPNDWNKFHIKSIAVTRNGTTMVLAGHSSKLIVFSLDTWSLTKILNLPGDIYVKLIDFVSQAHDGGANKYLVILTTAGVIHLLDMEESIVIGKIQQPSEMISFACATNGLHLSCILKTGEVNVHKIGLFLDNSLSKKSLHEGELGKQKLKLYLQSQKPVEELNLSKLQRILKEFGEYPEQYRTLIWTKILLLPNNIQNFRAINNKGITPSVNNIDNKYPLMNKSLLKKLKKLLSNLGNWSSFFTNMEFLPLFIFPFVKIFENDPLACFEAIITIILNWCQHWFEYAPVSPVNILAMIENVFVEFDAQLLTLLTEFQVTSHIYAWSLLETSFSEVLTSKEWCILWDHILSNEPAFILMIPVAYNIICRSTLCTLKSLEEFQLFYHNQNPIEIKKLISKSYYLLYNTSEARHPRKYFYNFQALPKGSYPVFKEYPKVSVQTSISNINIGQKSCTTIENCSNRIRAGGKIKSKTSTKIITINQVANEKGDHNDDDNHLKDIDDSDSASNIEIEIDKVQKEIQKLKCNEFQRQHILQNQREEAERIQLLEHIYQEELLQKQERVNKRKLELSKLKTVLFDMQAEALEKSRMETEELNLDLRKRELDKILKHIDVLQHQEDLEIQKTEEDLSRHYVELLEQKTKLEQMMEKNFQENAGLPQNYHLIEKQRKTLNKELEKMRKYINKLRMDAKVKVPMEIAMVNNNLQTLDLSLAKEMAVKQQQLSFCNNNLQLHKMEKQTIELEKEVENLLKKFSNTKTEEAFNKISHLNENVSKGSNLMNKQYELLLHRQMGVKHPYIVPKQKRSAKNNSSTSSAKSERCPTWRI